MATEYIPPASKGVIAKRDQLETKPPEPKPRVKGQLKKVIIELDDGTQMRLEGCYAVDYSFDAGYDRDLINDYRHAGMRRDGRLVISFKDAFFSR